MPRTNSKTCFECGAKLAKPGAFCSAAHKAAFHNRRAKRGALLLDVQGNLRKLTDAAEVAALTRRLELLWLKWDFEDAQAKRRSMTRSLADVRYDSELPREYEEGQYVLPTEAQVGE